MQLLEDEIIEKYAKHCGHCSRNNLLPYEYERTCISCGFNLIKRKNERSIFQRKRIKIMNRLKYAELKIFCISIGVYKIYENDDYDKMFEVLSTIKNKKIKINNILIEKFKDMLENHDFEQGYRSRTAICFYKIGYEKTSLMKWIEYYDRSFYGNIIYYDLFGSVLNGLCKYSYNCKYVSSINTILFVRNTHITKNSTHV